MLLFLGLSPAPSQLGLLCRALVVRLEFYLQAPLAPRCDLANRKLGPFLHRRGQCVWRVSVCDFVWPRYRNIRFGDGVSIIDYYIPGSL